VAAVRALLPDGSPADGVEVKLTNAGGSATSVARSLKADVCGYAIFFRLSPGDYRISAPGTDADGKTVKVTAQKVACVGWRIE
jgi:hypothetical protein